MWNFYGIERNGGELLSFEERLDARIRQSNQHKANLGIGVNLTGFRSTSPAHRHSIDNLDTLHKHYWQYGCTDLDQPSLSLAVHANPMFMSPDDNIVLHYGTDPLLGFHLATAYVPLASVLPSIGPSVGRPTLDNVVDAAKTEFYSWAKSFRKYAHSVRLRLFIGDALGLLSFSLQLMSHTIFAVRAHWYRDRFHFESLVLDGEDYADGCTAPLTFTIIDTSNLIDHVGAINLLVATAPLLANDISATLYTEKLVRVDSTYTSLFHDLLCGPLVTNSMLLGLTLVDSVTNTSAISSGDEILFDAVARRSSEKTSESGQLFTRILWKRPIRTQDGLTLRRTPCRVTFDPTGLATILYHTYLKMFENEDIVQMMSNITMLKLQRFSLPVYQRASFVAFVSILKSNINVDWEKTIRAFLDLIERNVSHLMTKNYIQELYVWLHLLNVYSVDTLKTPLNSAGHDSKSRDLRDWKNMPPVVCVTLEVPRERLKLFTDGDVMKIGTPPVHCLVQSSSDGRPWQNIFGAVQIGFGKVKTCGTPFSGSFEVGIVEDMAGWSGTSPLLASFYAPAWMLLLQPRTASVEFGIQSTPQSIRAFVDSLGLQMAVYQTTLADTEHVYVSKYLPNQSTNISICPFPVHDDLYSDIETSNANICITATVDSSTAKVASIACRVDVLSEDSKALLRVGGSVSSASRTPFNFVVSLQSGLNFPVDFPVAVLDSNLKIRIARKSSYVELISQAANGTDWPTFCSFMYPVYLDSGVVATWNMPYLNLQSLPKLDVWQPTRLDWLTTHTSMMFSSRERSLRNNPSQQAPVGERARVEFKDSLFSLFMHYSGLQGQRAHVFGLNCPTDGGIHILLFVSSLRLDLSNRTVVLDAAALPLYDALMPRITSFLQTLTNSGGLCQIRATEAEMRLWKQVLPAFVERCRTWSHKSDCQYLTEGRIPLSIERGKRLLCSCGDGAFPKKFVDDFPDWNQIAKYAVRTAISPSFAAAMFESGYDYSKLEDEAEASKAEACRVCRRSKKADGSGLLNCARCSRVKYCSRECQRADWKSHKGTCKAV